MANIRVINGMKELSRRFELCKEHYKMYLSRVFVCLRITRLMKNRYCRAGGSFHATLVGRIKRNFTFAVVTKNDIIH